MRGMLKMTLLLAASLSLCHSAAADERPPPIVDSQVDAIHVDVDGNVCHSDGGVVLEHEGQKYCGKPLTQETKTACLAAKGTIVTLDGKMFCDVPVLDRRGEAECGKKWGRLMQVGSQKICRGIKPPIIIKLRPKR